MLYVMLYFVFLKNYMLCIFYIPVKVFAFRREQFSGSVDAFAILENSYLAKDRKTQKKINSKIKIKNT